MASTGAAAVLFALVCCLLVGPAPARRPELLPQVVLGAVDREASAEPLLPAIVEVADPSTVVSSVHGQEVHPAGQAPQIISCGGEDVAVAEESLSLGTTAQPAGKSEVQEDVQERRQDDSDSDSDSDDEDNKDGILGWFWRMARRF
uniref:Uncharacterized protein n=1 Tax=Avena sativa TaxID=4498 RepID=A0ACD5VG07_AVESA